MSYDVICQYSKSSHANTRKLDKGRQVNENHKQWEVKLTKLDFQKLKVNKEKIKYLLR